MTKADLKTPYERWYSQNKARSKYFRTNVPLQVAFAVKLKLYLFRLITKGRCKKKVDFFFPDCVLIKKYNLFIVSFNSRCCLVTTECLEDISLIPPSPPVSNLYFPICGFPEQSKQGINWINYLVNQRRQRNDLLFLFPSSGVNLSRQGMCTYVFINNDVISRGVLSLRCFDGMGGIHGISFENTTAQCPPGTLNCYKLTASKNKKTVH